MKTTILQTDIKWEDAQANALHVAQIIDKAEKSDLYVLPEMWSTGFITNPKGRADDSSFALNWMMSLAERTNAAVCGSVAICDGVSYKNRFYFVFPDKTYRYYDKRHLFSYGGENDNYSAGSQRVIVEWKGFRFLLLVCYDLRFPVWSRNRNDYDAIIIVANWPDTRRIVWNSLLVARAIENQCYVVAANRVGNDPVCNYVGDSCIIDSKGRVMASADSSGECVITCDIDKVPLNVFRQKFRVLDDADSFEINV